MTLGGIRRATNVVVSRPTGLRIPGRADAPQRSRPGSAMDIGAASAVKDGASRGWLREQLLGDSLDVGGLDLALVRLHDVADEAPDLLHIRDAEGIQPLLHEPAQRVGVEPAGQIPFAQLDLKAELGGLGGAAVPELVELGERLLELLPVRADHVEDERIVDGAAEALRGAPLLELRL